jgi:hypothetical protein
MCRIASVLASLVGVVGALVIPAAASAQTVAQTAAATSVREFDETVVFSDLDRASGLWYLSVRRAGTPLVERLPVAPSPTSFEADIGPDVKGDSMLVYQRCRGLDDMDVPIGCDLFAYSLADATGEQALRSANDPYHDDVEPTIWGGRIAWARVYDSGSDARPAVYTRTLSAPRSRPSTRLPGVPRRGMTDRAVGALELWRGNLALMVDYSCRQCPGIVTRELRLDDVRRHTATKVAVQTIGMASQNLTGPSFFAGHLAWYKACRIGETACRTAVGPYRYTLSTRRYAKGTSGPVTVAGFADTGKLLYENFGCAPSPQEPSGPECRIEAVPPPRYAPTRPRAPRWAERAPPRAPKCPEQDSNLRPTP